MAEKKFQLQTLEMLEGNVWPNANFESHLVTRCHELRKVPINNLTTEDLRLLIGQQIGLNFILDIAIEKLEGNILAEGDFFPGDLLQNVLSIDRDFWVDNKKKWEKMRSLLEQNDNTINESQFNVQKFYDL